MDTCEHYWVIPNTPDKKCQGICSKCNARKEFLNRVVSKGDWESLGRKTLGTVARGSVTFSYSDEL